MASRVQADWRDGTLAEYTVWPASAVTPAENLDAMDPALQRVRVRIMEQGRQPGDAAELGDAGSHRPRSGDAENPRRAHDGTRALMPVRARPMMSFWICDVPSYRVVTRTSRK